MISFKPLENILKEHELNKTALKTNKIIGGGTYTILSKAMKTPINDGISISAINAICKALNCQPGDIMEYVPDEDWTRLMNISLC